MTGEKSKWIDAGRYFEQESERRYSNIAPPYHANPPDTTPPNRRAKDASLLAKPKEMEISPLQYSSLLVLERTALGMRKEEIGQDAEIDMDRNQLTVAYQDINRWAKQVNPNSKLPPIQNAIVTAIKTGTISIGLPLELNREILQGYQSHLKALIESPSLEELKKTPGIDITPPAVTKLQRRLHAKNREHLVVIAATYLYQPPQEKPQSPQA